MSDSRFTIDTNILVHAFQIDDVAKHERAAGLVSRAAERNLNCVLTLQALAEFYRVAAMKKAMTLDKAEEHVRDLRALFPIVAADADALERAMWAVRAHSLSFWDAMMWATAHQADCAFLLSEDFAHGRTLLGVTFWNPLLTEPMPESLSALA